MTTLAAGAVLALVAAAPAHAVQIVAIEPTAEITAFGPVAINDARQVVGNTSAPGRAAVWSNGNYRVLEPLPGYAQSAALDINDVGEVAGNSVNNFGHATRWSASGTPGDLGALGPGKQSHAIGINDHGTAVGDAQDTVAGSEVSQPVRYDPGGPTRLATAGGVASDINAGGDILMRDNAVSATSPVLLRDGEAVQLTCLSAQSDTSMLSEALNDAGAVVGWAAEDSNLPRRWQDGTCTDLDTPPGMTDLFSATAINNAGSMVGAALVAGVGMQALLWRPDGSVVTLDSLLPADSPWQLEFALDINDRGDIVGMGFRDGVRLPFVLSNRAFVVNDAGDGRDRAIDGVCDADAAAEGEQCTLRAAIAEVNATTDEEPVDVTFAIPGSGTPVIAPDGAALPAIKRPVRLDARTQPGGTVRIDGAAAGADVDGLTVDGAATASEVHGLTVTRFDGNGLRLRANDVLVQGNVLGAAADCADPCGLGNHASGVLVAGAAGVVVGRSVQRLLDGASEAAAGEPNVIAHNGDDGVTVGSAGTNDGDDVAWNRFAANGDLPIDLGGDGRTLNDDRDADGGANELLNSPVVTASRVELRAGARRLRGGGGLTGIPSRIPSVVLYAASACLDPERPDDLLPLALTDTSSGRLGLDDAGQGSWEADLDLAGRPADRGALVAATVTTAGTTSETSNCVVDSDRDGLNDPWERDGADPDGDGVVEVPLDEMGATVGRKDLFVEIDSMPGNPLSEAGLDLVRAAFADAPIDNPDGTSGVQVHLDNGPGTEMTRPLDGGARRAWAALSDHDVLASDTTLDMRDELGTNAPSLEPVYAIKRERFRWSRRFFFHYLLSARALQVRSFDQVGEEVVHTTAPAFGVGSFQDDTAAIATYGGLENDLRTPLAHAGLTMTAIGTMLGIGPGGGGDRLAGKPNYLSVTNPLFTWGLVKRDDAVVFDYSRAGAPADAAAGGSLLALDEQHLDETRGMAATGAVTQYISAYVCPPAFATHPGDPKPELRRIDDISAPVDWDCAGGATSTDQLANVNGDLRPNFEAGSLNPIHSTLLPREDWSHAVYWGGAVGGRGQHADDVRHDGSLGRAAAAEDDEPVEGEGLVSAPFESLAAAPVVRGDSAPPTVALEAGEDGRVVVTAADDRRLDALDVIVDGALTIVPVSGTAARHELTLPPGPHTIQAFAFDWALQRSATETRTIGAGGGGPAPGPGGSGPPPPGGGPAKTRLRFTARALKLKRGAVRIPLRNANAFSVRGDVALKRGKRRLGRAAFRIAAGKRKTVTVKLSKAGRRAVRGRRSVKVAVQIRVQGAGGRATVKRRVKLRR